MKTLARDRRTLRRKALRMGFLRVAAGMCASVMAADTANAMSSRVSLQSGSPIAGLGSVLGAKRVAKAAQNVANGSRKQ